MNNPTCESFRPPRGRRSGKFHPTTSSGKPHPTTGEIVYTSDEIEFMQALNNFKQTSGRKFPTCSEILEVIRGLGYVKGRRF